MEKARVYASDVDDNRRWAQFPFRDGDIVISTRSKSGTTWMQMICALLIFQTPDLPAPLAELSPWLDHAVEPLPVVVARLEAQQLGIGVPEDRWPEHVVLVHYDG